MDWALDVDVPAQRREAERLIALLLAPDRLDAPQALARRMGVEEIIWDCGYWGAGMEQARPYSAVPVQARQAAAQGRQDDRAPQPPAHRPHQGRRGQADLVLDAVSARTGSGSPGSRDHSSASPRRSCLRCSERRRPSRTYPARSRDAQRRNVLDVDVEVGAQRAELLEGPAREQDQRLAWRRRDCARPGARCSRARAGGPRGRCPVPAPGRGSSPSSSIAKPTRSWLSR